MRDEGRGDKYIRCVTYHPISPSFTPPPQGQRQGKGTVPLAYIVRSPVPAVLSPTTTAFPPTFCTLLTLLAKPHSPLLTSTILPCQPSSSSSGSAHAFPSPHALTSSPRTTSSRATPKAAGRELNVSFVEGTKMSAA